MENLNEFRSTILSRFDAIFLIKDTRNEARDRTIAEHVMKIHINHNNRLNNQNLMFFTLV